MELHFVGHAPLVGLRIGEFDLILLYRYAVDLAAEEAFNALPKLLFDVYYFDGYGNTRYTTKKGRNEMEVREKWEAVGRCGEIHTIELAN